MVKYGLPVKSTQNPDFLYGNENNKFLLKLAARTYPVESNKMCINNLQETKKIMCAISNTVAEHFMHRFEDPSKRTSIMKLAEPPLFSEPTFYAFEDSSPYIDKYAVISRRIREFGLQRMVDLLDGVYKVNRTLVEEIPTKNEGIGVPQLLIVLSLGYALSITAFTIESLLDVTVTFYYYLKKLYHRFSVRRLISKFKLKVNSWKLVKIIRLRLRLRK